MHSAHKTHTLTGVEVVRNVCTLCKYISNEKLSAVNKRSGPKKKIIRTPFISCYKFRSTEKKSSMCVLLENSAILSENKNEWPQMNRKLK